MEIGVWILTGALVLLTGLLLVKIRLLHAAAKEMEEAFLDRLRTDTNTLINTSSYDPYMRRLAAGINTGLRMLRRERHRYQQGDLELKDAVTNISHDLRTPLTAICGYLDLLKKEQMSGTARYYLTIMEERTEVLKQLTEELFCYSVTMSSGDMGEPEELSLNRVLEESLSAYYAVLKGCRIEPKVSMPDADVRRRLNRSALLRIFANILSNAVKYSDGDLAVTLLDTGELIFQNQASALTEVEVNRLFDRYYTVETTRKSTGLGLAISRLLTERMGGSISCGLEQGILTIRIRFSACPDSMQKEPCL